MACSFYIFDISTVNISDKIVIIIQNTCVPRAEKNPRPAKELIGIFGIAASERTGVVQVRELVQRPRDKVWEQAPAHVVHRCATPLGILV